MLVDEISPYCDDDEGEDSYRYVEHKFGHRNDDYGCHNQDG